ncbi:HNH endonuclease family protein [Leucobacter chironomi]|uniref:HNH endonuclease family protein n=1 Tax=Leucobacter chironomi TaxID=491918 RepID=UPI0003F51836|nr:HNH endonuclease family protein [Leucobacter chironomi]
MRALVLAALAVCALALAGAFVAQGSGEGSGSSASPNAGTGTLRQTQTQTQTQGPAGADRGAPPAPVAERTAAEVLDAIPVKGRAPKTGYDRRAGFGDGWKDPDRNGCDARNDALRRDLVDVSIDGRCRVLSGVLLDPYTGARIDFVRGELSSQAVQIDHVVALSDAWQKGAQALTGAQRIAFANDPLNLLAVDGAANSRKGDGDAATWLPPERGFRCEYVARQISVKAAYGLWVTDAEGDAMRRVLEACPDQPAYASALAGSALG